MYIAYTAEQEALRRELRAYYAELLTPEIREELHRGMGSGPTMRAVVRRMGADGWLGIGWPKEYGGQGRGADRAVHLLRRVDARAARRCRCSRSTPSAPTHHAVRQRRAEALLPAEDPRRARSTSASATPSPDAGTDLASLKTRAVRDGDDYVVERPEDLHEPRRRRRLHLARGAHGPERRRSTRASRCCAVDLKTPGIRIDPMHLLSEHDINTVFFDDVRVPVDAPGRRREQGLEADHEPAQPRARDALLLGPARAGLRGHAAPARSETQAARRPARHRPGVGAGQPRARLRGARVPAPHQLEGGLDGDARAGSTSPTRRPSRSSAPSSTSSRSGC